MSAGMTVTPALAEEATPEAAAPAETVAVDAPTFYANSHDVKAVVMNIGAAQDSVNVTWYGSTPTGGMLKYGVQGGEMTTLQAAVAPTSSEGWYKNTVTLTGLQSNTTYEYAVSADKDEAHYGETKTYTTQTFGKDEPYTFLVFGDPQIGCSGSIDDDNGGWTNTLNHALAKAPNANFLFSMGDQINAYYKYDTSNLSQVEEESQSKTSFLSRVSHEISTPMNGIIGVLTLARWILPHCSAELASFCASAAGKRENEGVPETPKIQPVSAKAEAILCLRNMRYFRCFELHR